MNDEHSFPQQPNYQQPIPQQTPPAGQQRTASPPASDVYDSLPGDETVAVNSYSQLPGDETMPVSPPVYKAAPVGNPAPSAVRQTPPIGGNVPPVGAQVPPAGAQVPPMKGYSGYPASNPSPIVLEKGKGGAWIVFMRVVLWVQFALFSLVGIAVFVCSLVASSSLPGLFDGAGSVLIGFLIMIGCILFAFLSVAMGMIFLDMAANIKRTTTNSAYTLELLLKKEK